MKHLDPTVEKTLRSQPDARLRCIVRTKGPPAAHRSAVEQRGLQVVFISTLINAITVEGKAGHILVLAAEDWVLAIELDKPVHTM